MPEDPFHGLRAGLVAAAAEEEFQLDVRAVRELDAGLIDALNLVESADSAQRDRLSAFLTLHHLARFLHAHPRWRAVALSLIKLQSALGDLEHGHVAPMLSPREIRGRPASSHQMMLRGFAAGIMGGLTEHAAMSRSEAAEWISKRLAAAGYEVAPNTVIGWRQNVLNNKQSYQHRAYREVIGGAAWRSTPLDFAEQLVSRLIRLQMQKEE